MDVVMQDKDEPKQKKCKRCDGTGDCSLCDGKGCTTCGNTGKCQNCSGTGKGW